MTLAGTRKYGILRCMIILKYIEKDVVREIRRKSERMLGFLGVFGLGFPIDVYGAAWKAGLGVVYHNSPLQYRADPQHSLILLDMWAEEGQKRFAVARALARRVAAALGLFVELTESVTGVHVGLAVREGGVRFPSGAVMGEDGCGSLLARDLYGEVIDYIAAQLLVPYEAFSPRKGEFDASLAGLFGVTEDCIVKRRAELPYEPDA